MKTTEVQDKLGYGCSVSVRKGVYTVRRGFFYRHDMDSQKLANTCEKAIPGCTIIDHGEVWKPFRGGAELRNSSHFWVKFTIAQTGSPQP